MCSSSSPSNSFSGLTGPLGLLRSHKGRQLTGELKVPISNGEVVTADFAGATWELRLDWMDSETPGVRQLRLRAAVHDGRARGVSVGLVWEDRDWGEDNYVLLPGAVYGGNRFSSERRTYPPSARDLGQSPERKILDIGDIPRLEIEGPSFLDQTSLDCAIPGIGIYCPRRKSACLFLTGQASGHGPFGLEMVENEDHRQAEIRITVPGFLHPREGDDAPMPNGIGHQAASHRHPENAAPIDLSAGEAIEVEVDWHRFAATGVHSLFERLLDHRRSRFPEANQPLIPRRSFSSAGDILEAKHNRENWNEERGFYQVGLPWADGQDAQFWQNGWLGGGIPTLAFLQEGSPETRDRALRNLDFLLTEGVNDLGFFKAIFSAEGHWRGDLECDPATSWVLVRRQGECLLFALRQVALLRERHPDLLQRHWEQRLQSIAGALHALWHRHHSLGFLVDIEAGSIAIDGSTSGALVPAALVLAADLFDEPDWLATAVEIGDHFRLHDLEWGLTTGGPGDAVQAPDSESVFGLIESFAALGDATRDKRWVEAAQRAAWQAASWVISYPYRFPEGSALATTGCDARGVVLANSQNKCGVPGLCTLSGEGLLRAFRASGDVRLLDLLREIAHAIPQYLSTRERPIPTRIDWGNPYPELPEGWICERVNITPSWPEPLGEQAAYSCWCEVAMLLTWNDLPGVYAQPDTGLIRALDHVNAEWSPDQRESLRLHNPTRYPARVRLLVESSEAASRQPLPVNFGSRLPVITLKAGESLVVPTDIA